MSKVEKAFEAIAVRNVERVKHLIESGVDVNAADDWEGGSLLHRAAFEGYAPMVGMLIHKGANVNAANNRGMTPLHMAVPSPCCHPSNDFGKVIKLLLEHGADVNAATKPCKATPLHFAVSCLCDGWVVALLLEHGADVDALDGDGLKPINHCFLNGDISDLLKEAKAKKDMKAQPQQSAQPQPQQKKNPSGPSSGPSFTPAHLL